MQIENIIILVMLFIILVNTWKIKRILIITERLNQTLNNFKKNKNLGSKIPDPTPTTNTPDELK